MPLLRWRFGVKLSPPSSEKVAQVELVAADQEERSRADAALVGELAGSGRGNASGR